MVRIAIFASGNGSNAENIIRYFRDSDQIKVILIISNNKNAYVHTRAKELGIISLTYPKAEFEQPENILNTLHEHKVDFIVLAGFMLKIPHLILEAFPHKILNIHPAMLPKFGGQGMYGDRVHKAVVEAGEKESGITIHYIDENYDEGDIVFQVKCELNRSDTYEDVAKRVHKLEYEYYPMVIEKVIKRTFNAFDEGRAHL